MKLINNKVYFAVQDYLMILLGTLLYGFGFNAFILSNEIITGGVSGICALIFFASNEIIPVSVSYFVINVVLLLAALKILGLKFLIKTIFGVFSLSASLSFFEWLLKGQPLLHDQPFMSIIIGAFLCGAGLGLVFSANGSTGGTDIVGAIVNMRKQVSAEDGRVTYLFLTESGQALSQKYNTDYFSQLLPYLDSISEEDAACTIQTLEKFYAIMRERKDSLEKR